MSSMGGHTYSIQSGRTLQPTNHNNPQTPYSAVSSFNLPVTYDSQLVTPVSMSASPSVPRTTTSPPTNKAKSIKMSPSSSSYYNFTEDDGFGGSRFNEPMKTKDGQATLYISTPESAFPAAPYPDPYFGNFGVSGTGSSTRTPITSPPLNPHESPSLNSASGSSNSSRQSRQPTPGQGNVFRSHNQAPILIAPNPTSLRKDSGVYRQSSLHSNHSHDSTPHSRGPPQMPFSHHQHQESHMLTLSSRKRKTPDSCLDELLDSDEQLSHEEKLLIRFTKHEQLPWKDVMVRFNEETGKSMKVPALQMRKKRLLERLRVWNDIEERALTLAMKDYEKAKWENIARDMLKYGSAEKWTKEAVQRKWAEMHPGHSFYRADSYFSPGQPSEQDLANRGVYQDQHRPSYPFGTPGSLGNNYQLQSGHSLHQRHHSLNETKSEDEDYQQHQSHTTPQLPPSHPLHPLQQAAQSQPPLRSGPEAGHSYQNNTPPLLSHYSPTMLPNIMHQQHLPPLPSVLTHPQQSPSLQARQGSSSSGPMSTVSTVTMDEVRSRAGSDAGQQMAIHKKQAHMMFEQQKLRGENRMRPLVETGGSTSRSPHHGLPMQDQNQGLGLGLCLMPPHNQQQGQQRGSPQREEQDQQCG